MSATLEEFNAWGEEHNWGLPNPFPKQITIDLPSHIKDYASDIYKWDTVGDLETDTLVDYAVLILDKIRASILEYRK
jgi:hypothetical protein